MTPLLIRAYKGINDQLDNQIGNRVLVLRKRIHELLQ
jgi:hypothetical protein